METLTKLPVYNAELIPDYKITFRATAEPNPGLGLGYCVIESLVAKNYKVYNRIPLGDQVTNNQAAYITLIESIKKLIDILGRRNIGPANFNLEVVCCYQPTVVASLNKQKWFEGNTVFHQYPEITGLLAQFKSYRATFKPRAEILAVLANHK